MSRHELEPSGENTGYTHGVVGWDRPLQSFFAQLIRKDARGQERIERWLGTYPGELPTASAAIAIVAGACIIPPDLAAMLEIDRLKSLGDQDTPHQRQLKQLLVRPRPSERD